MSVGSAAKNSIVVGPALAAVKLVLVAILCVIGTLVGVLGVLVGPFSGAKRSWDRSVAYVFGRLVLFLLGFYSLRHESVELDVKRDSEVPRLGHVIVANHSSYIDLIYLYTFYCPVFTEICGATNRVRKVSFLTALLRTGEYPTLENPECTMTIAEICALDPGTPVVVFPEGTTTNGRGLLRFARVLEGVRGGITVVGIRYLFVEFDPAYIVGGKASHLIGVAAQWVNVLDVKTCDFVPAREAEGVTESVAQRVELLTGLKRTGFGVEDKKAFFDLWLKPKKKE
ncbi:hypothetical protein HDU98_009540 [Podochytrium sp. JEL0797]|nr:hypothetical protein HDU98_009540 [Podochytrium sp. JEL0797]